MSSVGAATSGGGSIEERKVEDGVDARITAFSREIATDFVKYFADVCTRTKWLRGSYQLTPTDSKVSYHVQHMMGRPEALVRAAKKAAAQGIGPEVVYEHSFAVNGVTHGFLTSVAVQHTFEEVCRQKMSLKSRLTYLARAVRCLHRFHTECHRVHGNLHLGSFGINARGHILFCGVAERSLDIFEVQRIARFAAPEVLKAYSVTKSGGISVPPWHLDPAADAFSFGAIMLKFMTSMELVVISYTGDVFLGNRDKAVAALKDAERTRAMVEMGITTLRKADKGIQEGLQGIILSLLSPNPAERPFLRDVEEQLYGLIARLPDPVYLETPPKRTGMAERAEGSYS